MQSGLQAIDVGHDPLVQFDERGAGLAEASIVVRQPAEVREFAGRQRAQTGLTLFGPGNHGGGVERPLVRGAVTGGLTAASPEVVDGTFDESTQREQGIDLTLVIAAQRLEGLTKTAGAIGCGGQGRFLFLYAIYHKRIKNARSFIKKVSDRRKYFLGEATVDGVLPSERDRKAAEALRTLASARSTPAPQDYRQRWAILLSESQASGQTLGNARGSEALILSRDHRERLSILRRDITLG